jgi:hypothetical protein
MGFHTNLRKKVRRSFQRLNTVGFRRYKICEFYLKYKPPYRLRIFHCNLTYSTKMPTSNATTGFVIVEPEIHNADK